MSKSILEERLNNFIDENESQHNMMLDEIRAFKKDLQERLKTFVTQDRFSPIEKLVYSLVGIILSAVVLGLVGLLIAR